MWCIYIYIIVFIAGKHTSYRECYVYSGVSRKSTNSQELSPDFRIGKGRTYTFAHSPSNSLWCFCHEKINLHVFYAQTMLNHIKPLITNIGFGFVPKLSCWLLAVLIVNRPIGAEVLGQAGRRALLLRNHCSGNPDGAVPSENLSGSWWNCWLDWIAVS